MQTYSIDKLLFGDNMYDDSLIVFSGGMDSTLVLIQEVERIKRNGKGKLSVIYHESGYINKNKTNNELKSIEHILLKIKKDFDVDVQLVKHQLGNIYAYDCEGIESDTLYISNNVNKSGTLLLPQTVIWTGMIIEMLPVIGNSRLNIMFGFNMNDNLHGYSANMVKHTIESYYTLINTGDKDCGINVIFPLITSTKEIIYDELLKKYTDFFDLTWTCELPIENVECGMCTPCTTKLQTMASLMSKQCVRTDTDYVKMMIDRTSDIQNKYNKIKTYRSDNNE